MRIKGYFTAKNSFVAEVTFNKKKDRTSFSFLESHACKDSYHLNTSEEDELRYTFIFMNESLTAENRKLLKLARSESKKKTINIKGTL